MNKATSVDDYINSAPEEVQGKLKELRSAIKSAAPDAEEKISYGMPYYGYLGRLVYFAYAKNHIGVYAMPMTMEGFKQEIEKYQTGKATLRFPLDEDLPIGLIKKLVKAGVENNLAKSKK